VVAPLAGAGAAAAGLVAPVEVFGLNKSPRLNFGDAAGLAAAAALAFVRARFPAGEAAGDAAGLAAVAPAASLRVRFALGEAAGEAAGEGDAAVSVAAAVVAAAFLRVRCFAGDSAGLGDWSCAIHAPANPITQSRARILVVITTTLRKPEHHSQSNSDTPSGLF